jgi:quercetin dioxygenase-like cupin family protein
MTPPAAGVDRIESRAAIDPTVSDPDKYRAILHNEHVRVLRYHDGPGAKTHPHDHPASVLYALSAFRRRLIFPDGTVTERDFKPGDVMWIPAQTHTGENIGSTDTEVLLVEFLEGPRPQRR